MTTPYPNILPSAELQNLALMAIGRNPMSLKEAVHQSWHVVGYLLYSLVGDDDHPEIFAGEQPVDEALASLLAEWSASVHPADAEQLAGAGFNPLEWITQRTRRELAKWLLPLVLDQLRKFLAELGLDDVLDDLLK